MKKLKVYLDTSVISYLYQIDAPEKNAGHVELMESFQKRCLRCVHFRHCFKLAEKFIDFGILKQKSFDDCQHIAAAILAGCDIITSWNFKHIVNVRTVKGVKVITTLEGYKDLLIYPPSVLLEEGDDND